MLKAKQVNNQNKSSYCLLLFKSFADISLYDSALESASEESLPTKLSKDSNKFLYLAVIVGLVIMIIAVLLQLSQ